MVERHLKLMIFPHATDGMSTESGIGWQTSNDGDAMVCLYRAPFPFPCGYRELRVGERERCPDCLRERCGWNRGLLLAESELEEFRCLCNLLCLAMV